jgi:hypothetical protein
MMLFGLDIEGMEDIPEHAKEQFDQIVAESLVAFRELPPEAFAAGLMRFKPTVQSYIIAMIQFGEPF